MMRYKIMILISVLGIMMSSCNAQVDKAEANKNEVGIEIIREPQKQIDDVIELYPTDTFELSLYTTGGIYNIINLDDEEIYRMLKDISVYDSYSIIDEAVGGTSGGRIIVNGDELESRVEFKVTGVELQIDGICYEVDGANEIAKFIMNTRIMLNQYLSLEADGLESDKGIPQEPIEYDNLMRINMDDSN